MNIDPQSPFLRGASTLALRGPFVLPASFGGPRHEFLATRTSAALGVTLSISPVYDVSGPDAIPFLNSVTVNRNWGLLREGASRHAIITDDRGRMLADGVAFLVAEGRFRTYWLAPVLKHLLETSDLQVEGEQITDEFFFQLDGPRSLEILERVSGADLQDLRFAHNTRVTIEGMEVIVHRLGMSGALAYELHGDLSGAETVYARIRAVLEEYGGTPQGVSNYAIILHSPAGYPNQFQHFLHPYRDNGPGLAAAVPAVGLYAQVPVGSASDDVANFYSTPFDVGWGSLVDFDHEFTGKAALQEIARNPPRTMVTLEWDPQDVAEVFASQFEGREVEPYEPIEHPTTVSEVPGQFDFRGDYVIVEGGKIGISTGRTFAYWERRMISLASIDTEHAVEGKRVSVLWGSPGRRQKEIAATVARFPYYREDRNETFDTSEANRPPSS